MCTIPCTFCYLRCEQLNLKFCVNWKINKKILLQMEHKLLPYCALWCKIIWLTRKLCTNTQHIFTYYCTILWFKDGPQLILRATWSRRPAGTTIAFQFRTSKRFWYRFYVRNWNVIVVTSWPARPSCAQNQLRTVLKCVCWLTLFNCSD